MRSESNTTICGRKNQIWYDNAGNIMVKKDDFDVVLQALKTASSQLDAVSQGFEYPPEVLIARVEKAKDVIAKFERVGGE